MNMLHMRACLPRHCNDQCRGHCTWTSVFVEFRDAKIQPSLERALRHREILRA
jgi:hypothetical protein